MREQSRLQSLEIEFHRVELRLVRSTERYELGTAVSLGWDDSTLDEELQVEALSLGPRLWFDALIDDHISLLGGLDLLGSVGEIESLGLDDLSTRARRVRLDVPLYADAAARSAGGGYLELLLAPVPWAELQIGARADLWLVQGEPEPAVDPRARFSLRPDEQTTVHVAAGLTHQPAAYLFPLPGLTETAVGRGLQDGYQAELGVARNLPASLAAEVQGYLHYYTDLLLPEMYTPDADDDLPRVDAIAYGLEVLLRRANHEALSGWISYTLGWAEATEPGGRKFRPTFDVRHVLNLVAQLRLDFGLELGVRVHARTGRPVNQFTDQGVPPAYELRLPGFARADARVGYRWLTDWGQMLLYAEWLNLGFAQETLGADCFYGMCTEQRGAAVIFPNLGLRGQF